MLARHAPPLVVIKDEPGDYQLTTDKPVVIGKRKMDSVWFAGLTATKSGITLRFMPAYCNPEFSAKLSPMFMKTLKGKACFHIGKFPPEFASATEGALKLGVDAYRNRGWLSPLAVGLGHLYAPSSNRQGCQSDESDDRRGLRSWCDRVAHDDG